MYTVYVEFLKLQFKFYLKLIVGAGRALRSLDRHCIELYNSDIFIIDRNVLSVLQLKADFTTARTFA